MMSNITCPYCGKELRLAKAEAPGGEPDND